MPVTFHNLQRVININTLRPGHSTESPVLHVLSDVTLAVDRGDFAALASGAET